MPLSAKANEIRESVVNDGKGDYWFGVTKQFVEKKKQYEPGPNFKYDHHGLAKRLKAELSGQIDDVNDGHWDEFAAWLFENAPAP
jgi:hypothetical protein